MKLHTGNLFWDETRRETEYLTLEGDLETQVLVIGGGMSGAMIANELVRAGHQVTVVDKGVPGLGSSDGNTGIIQYCSDMSLREMTHRHGERHAVDFYRFSVEGMAQLGALVRRAGEEVGYRPGNSLYLAGTPEGVSELQEDVRALQSHGFDAAFVEEGVLRDQYGLHAFGAMRTGGDANLNPYKLVQALHRDSLRHGARVYRDAEVLAVDEADGFTARVGAHTIRARVLVLAAGYARDAYPPIEAALTRHTTFSFVTAPVDGPLWGNEEMIWDDREPYTYFRVTEDRRLIAGGRDRTGRALSRQGTVEKETDKILDKMCRYYPPLQAAVTHRWQSVYGESLDGLPFIGQDPQNPNKYYAFGYGGNGTCYCAMASLLIRDALAGTPHPLAYTTAYPRMQP